MKSRFFTTLLITISTFAFAGGKDTVTDINAALQKARMENKMLFLQLGREKCENCQALREMVSAKQVQLPSSKFVYADVNYDDPATLKAFNARFHVIGDTLPFVVVASPDGRQLAARFGKGTAVEYSKLIQAAEKALAK